LFTPSTYSDKILSCVDCNQEFVFAASDQQFYAEKEFSDPRRCASCRAARKAARGESGGYSGSSGGYSGSSYGGGSGYGASSGYGGGQREMFTATCDGCGGEARVPFRPTGSKPVYCSNCFSTRR
jgi:CxxC-x17-CxxC domain-containing protein